MSLMKTPTFDTDFMFGNVGQLLALCRIRNEWPKKWGTLHKRTMQAKKNSMM